jgi:3'-phosphoadenosine 5'-phosphosulfate sulfotransferase (PAPS reductase)/FAD synthetase
MTAPTEPFLIHGPALVSFSGGRTSAYMLWRILQAHGGKLPEDVVVAFANTGKEREETLRFVQECGQRWRVPIRWLEWRARSGDGLFEEVGPNSAARNGEPFEARIDATGIIPNSFMRICTIELKVKTMQAFVRSLGWDHCINAVGLRADEGKRVHRQHAQSDPLWSVVMPLYDAGITRDDVMEFWSGQDFDLGLQPWEGNCDLCFLKGERILTRLIYDDPTRADWWIEQERKIGHQFRKGRRSYAALAEYVRKSPLLPILDPDEEYDVECGLTCASEAA